MSTVYVDDITLLSQSLLRVKETSYESASEEPGLSPRMTESNLYPLIRLPKNSLLLSGAKSQRSRELYIRDSALSLYFSRCSSTRQDRHQKHHLSHRHYILPHLGHTSQRIHHSLYHNHRHWHHSY